MAAPDPAQEGMAVPLLRALRTSAAKQLALAGRDPCRFPLVWGDTRPPSEFCDCTCTGGEGAAWVRLVRLGPSRQALSAAAAECASGLWSATVEIGVQRCDETTLAEDGTPPDENTVTAQAERLALDAAVLRRSVRCSPWLDRWGITWTIDNLSPLGPAGGCVGAALTCVFDLSESCGCPEVVPA